MEGQYIERIVKLELSLQEMIAKHNELVKLYEELKPKEEAPKQE